ncbi:MAG TPA: hypothetical protein VMT46_05190 [Anaerolineaceae bacterium]|nr:hypothetical protein [Anaerolineaceae bacterium]
MALFGNQRAYLFIVYRLFMDGHSRLVDDLAVERQTAAEIKSYLFSVSF